MRYGDIFFDTVQGSTSITTQKQQEVRHVPYTNQNIIVEKGKMPTIISTTILVLSENEKNKILGMLSSSRKDRLYIGSHFYKDVVPGESANPAPLKRDHKDAWTIEATFIALDPIPYNAETGEPLYE